MPWKKVTIMSQRKEFTVLAMIEGANISQLCRGFGISRKTGYKWIDRFADRGDLGLMDRSRRPHLSPLAKPRRWRRRFSESGSFIRLGVVARSGLD